MPEKFLARLSTSLKKNKSTDTKAAFGIGALLDGRYRLEAELGRGGMGIVYRARDIPNKRDAALKIINMDRANDLTLRQFKREADISALLDHPNIVTVYETGVADIGAPAPVPFIALELVQGKSLDEMREFTYARIIEIGKQICAALEHIHNRGIVYRDLKPANIILEKRGFRYCVKLLDFGLARPRNEAYLPNESSLAGSFFYLAPELILGQPADVGSDLYALGVTLYEMITGRVPFSDFDEQTILVQHLEQAAAPPSHSRSGMPPALETIVLRLLEKAPKDRFASAQEALRALEQVKLADETAARKGNLPQIQVGGRDTEIAQITQLLEASRLVTLLNKDKRLALAAGIRLNDQFTDGAWLVDLEEVSGPMWVLETIALALGIHEDRRLGLVMSLIEHLREKNLLLVLCNCDRFLPACVQFAETILRACPEVYILATSREPLNIPDEKTWLN